MTTEIIDLIIWAYTQGYSDAIKLLEIGKISDEDIKKKFEEMFATKIGEKK